MSWLQKLNPSTHTIIHFIGCYAIAQTLFHAGISMMAGFLITCALGLLWEVADAVNSAYNLHWPTLDPKGSDIIDFAVDVLGACLALALWSLW